MLATLGGILALIVGLALLLLPVVVSELSRPRDSAWGAVVLLLGLVLVTSADRLTGAPMLAVLCGGLLIGRLGTEVAQARWRQLSSEEQAALGSSERWIASLNQLLTITGQLLATAIESLTRLQKAVQQAMQQRRQSKGSGKRWVRQESPAVRDGDQVPAEETTAEVTADETVPSGAGVTPPEETDETTNEATGEAMTPPEPVAEEAMTVEENAAPAEPGAVTGSGDQPEAFAAGDAAPEGPTRAGMVMAAEPEEPAAMLAATDESLSPDAAGTDAEVEVEANTAESVSPAGTSLEAPHKPTGAGDGPERSMGEAERDSRPDPGAVEGEAAADPAPPAAADPLQVIQSFEEIDALLDLPSRRPAEPGPIVDVEVEDLAVEAMDADSMPPIDPDRR